MVLTDRGCLGLRQLSEAPGPSLTLYACISAGVATATVMLVAHGQVKVRERSLIKIDHQSLSQAAVFYAIMVLLCIDHPLPWESGGTFLTHLYTHTR